MFKSSKLFAIVHPDSMISLYYGYKLLKISQVYQYAVQS